MKRRHLDCEGKKVIDERVEELVRHGLSWHVCHGFQAIVDVQGWDHHQESVGVDGTDEGSDDERVPRFVAVIFERVGGVCEEKGDGDHVEIFEGYRVIFFGLLFGF